MIFSRDAEENILITGNVWGVKILKHVDWNFGFSWIWITIEIRSSKTLMGRFGGGWNWKFGLQFSSLKHILFFFGIGTIGISVGNRAKQGRNTYIGVQNGKQR